MFKSACRRVWVVGVGFCLLLVSPARGLVLDEATAAFNRGDYDTTVALLSKEVDVNPGHEAAYLLLAQAYERKKDLDRAKDVWTRLQAITRDEPTRATVTRSLLRIRAQQRGRELEKEQWKEDDPFHVPGIHELIDYRGLEVVDDAGYKDTLIGGRMMHAPPILFETRHFSVYACNEKLAKTVGMLCEKYLAHLMKRILDERAWAFHVPVLVYKDREDYWNVGGAPRGSAGVTAAEHIGRTHVVMCYQNSDKEDQDYRHSGNPVMGNIEDVLPHELTHVVINEFFGAQNTPRWLHEAFARQMEQNRKDYEEAGTLARDAVAGEYFRFRDLFAAVNYPSGSRIFRFYEQSASIALFLLGYGPEATRAFLNELRNQHGHDAAAAAALGIDDKGAVEEFERRWVEWMKERYAKDLERPEVETKRDTTANSLAADMVLPPIDEVASAAKVKKWRAVDLSKPLDGNNDAFIGVGDSKADWKTGGGKLRCGAVQRSGASFLGIRMNERVPLAVRCNVRWLADEDPRAKAGWFGFGMLNYVKVDTGAEALTKLTDGAAHDVVCFVGDDIALFVDGKCTGRFPAPPHDKSEPDIDYPVALLSHSALEVTNLEVATIPSQSFVGQGEGAADESKPAEPGQPEPQPKAGGKAGGIGADG